MIVAHGVYRVNEKIKTGRNSHVPVFHMQSLLVGVVSGIETQILFLQKVHIILPQISIRYSTCIIIVIKLKQLQLGL